MTRARTTMAGEEAQQPAHKKARLSHFSGGTFKVLVGSDKQPFDVHKDLICSRSPFFQAACSKKWSTSGNSTAIELPVDDPEIFDIYLHILYTQNINASTFSEAYEGEKWTGGGRTFAQSRIVSTYILADKFGDAVTANKLIDCLGGYCGNVDLGVDAQVMVQIARNTTNTSPLYRLAVDYYIHRATTDMVEDLLKTPSLAVSFIGDILKEKTNLDEDNRSRKISDVYEDDFIRENSRRYHQHDKQNPADGCATCKENSVIRFSRR